MFSVFNNQIHGNIPETIGNLIQLESLNAGYNQLEGEIPESIGNLVNLERLWLNYNHLIGEVPSTICNLNMLNWSSYGFEGDESYLNDNQLCPPYPECISHNIGYQDTSECFPILLGDMNNDGILNVLDIVQVVNLVLANEYEANGDLNSDGIINVLDIVQLVNIILN